MSREVVVQGMLHSKMDKGDLEVAVASKWVGAYKRQTGLRPAMTLILQQVRSL